MCGCIHAGRLAASNVFTYAIARFRCLQWFLGLDTQSHICRLLLDQMDWLQGAHRNASIGNTRHVYMDDIYNAGVSLSDKSQADEDME
jgi:hypothetical protein